MNTINALNSNYMRYKKAIGKSVVLATLLFLCGITHAQTLSAGGWRTSTGNPFTKITANNNLGVKVYRIECTNMVDATILQFKITVDGVDLLATFQEGSSVVVEGATIAIQQLTPGTMVKGTWAIIQQTDIPASTIPWNYFPSLTTDLLVASLKVDQEFLLSINYSSASCSNTSFIVFIDGQAVKDASGNTLKFLEGSTVYGKGKSVVIRASGTCTGNNSVNGDLKIKK